MAAKIEMMSELRTMLREVLVLRNRGAGQPRLARSQGMIDGYMRALLDGGLASKEELLELVAQEREAASGPATRNLELADSAA